MSHLDTGAEVIPRQLWMVSPGRVSSPLSSNFGVSSNSAWWLLLWAWELHTKVIFGLLFLPRPSCAPWWLCRKLFSYNTFTSLYLYIYTYMSIYIYVLTYIYAHNPWKALQFGSWLLDISLLQKNKMDFWCLMLKGEEKLNRKLECKWCEPVLM